MKNNEVLLDRLSGFLMVEQCGWQLYRVVGSRAADPELQARYQEFGEETDRHLSPGELQVSDLGNVVLAETKDHAERNLSDGAKLPSSQETPTSRTSAGA